MQSLSNSCIFLGRLALLFLFFSTVALAQTTDGSKINAMKGPIGKFRMNPLDGSRLRSGIQNNQSSFQKIKNRVATSTSTNTSTSEDFWQQTNGPSGGNVSSIAIDAAGRIFAGYYGLFRSTDGGNSWIQVSTEGVNVLAINSSGHIFAGQYGVQRSTDHGTTWTQVNTGLTNMSVQSLSISPNGNVFAGTEGGSVFRSMDNGDNWTQVGTGLSTGYIFSLAINSNGDIFAGTADSGHVFRSTDNGASWIQLNTGLDYVYALSFNSSGDIFAGSGNRGVARSTDNGANWALVNTGLTETSLSSVVINSNGYIFAGSYGGGGVFRSTDNGASWTRTVSGLANLRTLSLAVDLSGNIYAGTSGGIYISNNNGNSWSELQLKASIIKSLTMGPNGHLYAGVYGDGVAHSTDNGLSWIRGNGGLTYGQLYVEAVGTNTSGHVFSGSQNGISRSTDEGATWTKANISLTSGGTSWINAFAAKSNGFLFAGGMVSTNKWIGAIFRSTDNGINWTQVYTDLSASESMRSLAVNSSGDIFAGNDSGYVFRSTDDGMNWTPIRTGTRQWEYINSIVFNASGHIFLGSNYGIARSTDNGGSWTAVNTGLTNTNVTALTINSSGSIFAGTYGGGVFRSTDNGGSWTELNSGLTNTDVSALAINSSGYIFVGTYGGGVFRSVQASMQMPPTITDFNPTSGPIGTTVTITGTNFNTTAANNVVYFGAVRATVTAATSTSLTVAVPVGATYQPISVTVNGLTAYSSQPFIVTFPSSRIIDSTSFASKVDFATGTNPEAVAICDIDGDGKPDLIITNGNSNTVSVFRNTSTSGSITANSFAAKVDFAAGAHPYRIAIGDVDGDGKPDLVITNNFSNTVSVFRNTSTSGSITASSFAEKVDFITGTYPEGVAIGDVDGDGKPDLVITRGDNSNIVTVLRNTSTAGSITASSFASKVDFTTGAGPLGVAIGDLDGDGKPDLVVANSSNTTISVFRNTSTPGSITASSFASKVDFTTGTSPFGIVIGDVDGDGKPDLVVLNFSSNTVSVFRNTSISGSIMATSFASKVDFATGTDPYGIAIGDVDGDGKPDLVVSNSYTGINTVSVIRNTSVPSSITFASKVDFTTGMAPWGVAIGDVDGDGKPDLAVLNANSNTISVLRNTIGLLLAPIMVSVKDVPNDNGKQVWVRWSVPAPPASNNITSFGVWRNDSVWTYVMEAKTTNEMIYQVVAPTIFDSTKSKGQYLTSFRVTAHTQDPSLFTISQPMSGYSLDNLPPLAPTAVSGSTFAGGYRISWKAAINQFNDFKNYVLYRSENASAGPSTSTKLADVFDTVYNDNTVQIGKVYYYKITSIDYSGNESMPASLTANITAVNKEDGAIPEVFGLDQNYPNPFNPSTTIQYGLPTRSIVRLIIYDMLGQVISELINAEQEAGYQSVVWNANVASGLYFYRLEAVSVGDPSKRFIETKKMLLLK